MSGKDPLLRAVLSVPGTRTYEPALVSRGSGFDLPPLHEALLAESDGLLGYGGYVRLFGVTDEVMSLAAWNREETWKFAWPAHVMDYLCFGETAWGDQYAYRIEDLRPGNDPAVYFLESITLQAERLATDFRAFLKDELLQNCRSPYDDLLVAARQKLGDLPATEHLAYIPSPLITGDESLENVARMPARAAMIANGDLACALAGESMERAIDRIEPYTDEKGRPRLRVVWAGPQ